MDSFDIYHIPDEFFAKIEFENIQSVSEIVNDVKQNGDEAVRKYSEKFGDGIINNFIVSEFEIKAAYKKVSQESIEALKFAIKNIRQFAEAQLSCIKELKTEVCGSELGHKIIPIERVGCYIPGGNYPLPSSALMTIIPAKVAGVKEIIACSPKIHPLTIVACDLAGADVIYKIGGVQAIAAMAYGTKTVKKVNKIVGPGNKFVTSAKKQVFGECGIDFLAGPSEVMIIADDTANPDFVAADMLAQCEHDLDAKAYLLCTSAYFAQDVFASALRQLRSLETKDIAEKSFKKSYAIVCRNFEEMKLIAELKAPEHLELCFKDAENYVDEFKNYGSLFVGNYSAEVFGDYVSGTNHTLPTNQVAKYSGGLSVFDFIKIQTYQIINKNRINEISKNSSILAENEGLFAHKFAADIRKED